ncbi:MAG: ATPase [delta proteobacterium ML8_D]|nr:MAG: ATPase [delta proteobacterium ML8_D]
MKRYLTNYILDDLKKKIVLLTGPRQSGKTTLSKMLSNNFDYLNFDNPEHRLGLIERSWDRSKDLIIFDELHKFKNWKSWLKGIYDTEGVQPRIIVTGSAKLDIYRKVGDSLAGRFFQFRLHPLDLKEIKRINNPDNLQAVLDLLLDTGGFPEPYLEGSTTFYNRWKRSHLDIILKQDIVDLENVRQITSIETLIQLLRKRVGNPVSYKSLAQDLQCSDKTVKRWLTVLENMYIIFRVGPFHRNIARSILKAPKYYFYDTGQVIGDSGIRLENLTACALLKEIHYIEDCYGEQAHLYYLKTKDSREIDFFITRNEVPFLMIEVKWADSDPNRNFSIFGKRFPGVKKVQIVKKLDREKTYPDHTEIRSAHNWLADFSLYPPVS